MVYRDVETIDVSRRDRKRASRTEVMTSIRRTLGMCDGSVIDVVGTSRAVDGRPTELAVADMRVELEPCSCESFVSVIVGFSDMVGVGNETGSM